MYLYVAFLIGRALDNSRLTSLQFQVRGCGGGGKESTIEAREGRSKFMVGLVLHGHPGPAVSSITHGLSQERVKKIRSYYQQKEGQMIIRQK